MKKKVLNFKTKFLTTGMILLITFSLSAQVRSGTAYRWFNNTASTGILNQTAAVRLNNGNNDDSDKTFLFSGTSSAGEGATFSWQMAGLIFPAAVTVNKFTFKNGYVGGSGSDGRFATGFGIQGTTDGVTWTDLAWNSSPAYPYTGEMNNQSFVLSTSGLAPTLLGIRIFGQIRINGNSWDASVVELMAEYEGTLPITLKSFNIEETNCKATVKWATLSEVNVNEFQLQKSTDGLNFVTASVQKANNYPSNYQNLVDLTAGITNYFRLKVLDKDGTFTYTDIKSEKCSNFNNGINFSPNPATTNVTIADLNVGADIKVHNLSGLLVYNFKTESNSHVIDVSNWIKGIYVISIMNGKEIITKKIIVQ